MNLNRKKYFRFNFGRDRRNEHKNGNNQEQIFNNFSLSRCREIDRRRNNYEQCSGLLREGNN